MLNKRDTRNLVNFMQRSYCHNVKYSIDKKQEYTIINFVMSATAVDEKGESFDHTSYELKLRTMEDLLPELKKAIDNFNRKRIVKIVKPFLYQSLIELYDNATEFMKVCDCNDLDILENINNQICRTVNGFAHSEEELKEMVQNILKENLKDKAPELKWNERENENWKHSNAIHLEKIRNVVFYINYTLPHKWCEIYVNGNEYRMVIEE